MVLRAFWNIFIVKNTRASWDKMLLKQPPANNTTKVICVHLLLKRAVYLLVRSCYSFISKDESHKKILISSVTDKPELF